MEVLASQANKTIEMSKRGDKASHALRNLRTFDLDAIRFKNHSKKAQNDLEVIKLIYK